MHLKPAFFFNLKEFEHRGLFDAAAPVWAAFANLPFYVRSMLAHYRTVSFRDASDLRMRFPLSHFAQPDSVWVHPTAVIKPFCLIEGEVLIDEDAVVGPNAYIRGPTVIGKGARVGHCSEIKRSVLFPGAKAPHKNSVLDSIFGHDVNFAAALTTLNKRMSGKSVEVLMPNGTRIDTGMAKLGLIAGDGCSFGGGLRFNPGDYYPPATILYPGKRP